MVPARDIRPRRGDLEVSSFIISGESDTHFQRQKTFARGRWTDLVRPVAKCRRTVTNTILAIAAASVFILPMAVRGQRADTAPEGTFSIVARDPATGELGMGVQSKALATGSRTMTIKGGVAAIAHQSQANPMYGSLGLELLTGGMSPQQALELMLRGDEGRETRQVAIIDATGRTAAWTGSAALTWKGHQCGRDYCTQGNILTGPEVVQEIVKSFEGSTGETIIMFYPVVLRLSKTHLVIPVDPQTHRSCIFSKPEVECRPIFHKRFPRFR